MMTDCVMTLTYDGDADQVVLDRLPLGPAGGASLTAADGVELLFDCADGLLSQVVVGAGTPARSALAVVGVLFGPQASESVRRARDRDGAPVVLMAQPNVPAAMSRLARLDAARLTSPVAGSPWWAVEAAQLAARAGLTARATAETGKAARAMDDLSGESLADVPATAILAVADLVHAAEPELAERLRDHARTLRPATAQSRLHGSFPTPVIAGGRDPAVAELQWWLDPRTIPPGVFQHAWEPDAELSVRTQDRGIAVEADLVPGADRRLLRNCRVRLVDPANRKVIGSVPFRGLGDSRVTAELHGPIPEHEAWVEVVDYESRPVLSGELRHMRRAMRWADAALRAGRRSPGPVDAERARAAALAWESCARDWAAAGDQDRACLATIRRAAASPGTPVPEPPSAWAKELAGRASLTEAPFLAETVGS
jgi:hypothetical protein